MLPILWDAWPLLESGLPTMGHNFKNQSLLFPVVNHSQFSLAKGGLHAHSPSGILSGCSCACCHNHSELHCATALLCPENSFLVVFYHLWLLQSLCPCFYHDPWAIGSEVWYRSPISMSILKSLIFHILIMGNSSPTVRRSFSLPYEGR